MAMTARDMTKMVLMLRVLIVLKEIDPGKKHLILKERSKKRKNILKKQKKNWRKNLSVIHWSNADRVWNYLPEKLSHIIWENLSCPLIYVKILIPVYTTI